jgi:hypothetical protein
MAVGNQPKENKIAQFEESVRRLTVENKTLMGERDAARRAHRMAVNAIRHFLLSLHTEQGVSFPGMRLDDTHLPEICPVCSDHKVLALGNLVAKSEEVLERRD